MPTSSIKPVVLIPLGMLAAVIVLWQFPFVRFVLMLILLLFSLATALAGVIAKHRCAYVRGRITFAVFLRDLLLETIALLAAMVLAGWLGRTIAQLATGQLDNELLRLAAGITIGLLVGAGVGLLGSQARRRVLKIPAE